MITQEFFQLGGPFGLIVAAVTITASTAVSIAKGQLEANLQLMTDKYQKQLNLKKEKLIELSQIDLDSETVAFFMERLTKVSLG